MTGSITIIGAGKVGQALAKAFCNAGLHIDRVISRSAESARTLAETTGSLWDTDLTAAIDSDYVILAVPDNSIERVCRNLGRTDASIILHTAGSFGIDVFQNLKCKGSGVLYPLQTFTEGRYINIKMIPFLVEGDSKETEDTIAGLGRLLSDKVYRVKTADRKMVHLSAVFVCNFINHLLHAGQEIIGKTELPDSVLDALIEETFSKAREIGPLAAQTGPAARNDNTTIEKHIDLLSFSPELKEVYKAITRSIINSKPPR